MEPMHAKEDPVVIRSEVRQHAIVGHHFPPSIEIT
jgi:hypothetical protein